MEPEQGVQWGELGLIGEPPSRHYRGRGLRERLYEQRIGKDWGVRESKEMVRFLSPFIPISQLYLFWEAPSCSSKIDMLKTPLMIEEDSAGSQLGTALRKGYEHQRAFGWGHLWVSLPFLTPIQGSYGSSFQGYRKEGVVCPQGVCWKASQSYKGQVEFVADKDLAVRKNSSS